MMDDGVVFCSTGRISAAAVVLIDSHGRVLLTRRPDGKPMAGLWEFPGGKVHAQETPEDAAIRELQEEIGIVISRWSLTLVSYYDRRDLLLFLFMCRFWQGEIVPQEGQAWVWTSLDQLADYPMPLANRSFIDVLRDLL